MVYAQRIEVNKRLISVIISSMLLTIIMCDSELAVTRTISEDNVWMPAKLSQEDTMVSSEGDTKRDSDEDTKSGSEKDDKTGRHDDNKTGSEEDNKSSSEEDYKSSSEENVNKVSEENVNKVSEENVNKVSEENVNKVSEENTAKEIEVVREGVRIAESAPFSDESSRCRSEETKTTTTMKTTTPKVIILPKGPFYNFLVNICNTLLTKFYYRKIPSYLSVLRKSLKGLGPQYLMRRIIEKFRRRLGQLSRYNGNLLKVKVLEFLSIISSGDPMMNDFFYAMNAIFNVAADNKMDNYVYNLLRYGKTATRHIGEKTRETFVKLIFGTLNKQKEEVQDKIKLKFNLAVVEYMEKHKTIRKPLSELDANDVQAMKLIYYP